MSKLKVKLTDEITITTTYGDLLKEYWLGGNATGNGYGKGLWSIANNTFNCNTYAKNQPIDIAGSEGAMFDYHQYREQWESLFIEEPVELTEQQKAIQELKESMKAIQAKLDQLEVE